MRILALIFALLLAGCSRPHWNMTDISGSMPRLAFNLDGTTAQQFRGKVVALYFGYTHCPDVCPTTLSDLTQMLDAVKSPDVRVLFVTVDPERDSDAVLAQYARAFSPQITGLRGDANQLAALARTYRVAYSVKKGPPYAVMHSNAVFFFDRTGRARLVTTDTSDPYRIADDVKRLLN
jgi:protein SCO1